MYRPDQPAHYAQTDPGRYIPYQGDTGIDYRVMIPETETPQEAKGVMLRLIRIDTLRRVHNVGFLAGRLIFLSNTDVYCC